MFYLFLNYTRLPLSRIFLVSLLHRVGPAQANARRPKRSKFTFGTSTSNPPAERSDRRGAYWSSSAARYSGVPSYKALCTSTSSLYSIRFLTGSQCNCRSIVVMDCLSYVGVRRLDERMTMACDLLSFNTSPLSESHAFASCTQASIRARACAWSVGGKVM